MTDAVWIAQLLEHGPVRPSFVPPKPIRALRDLTRHRRTTVEDRTRAVQRLEKVMQDCGIKLTSVASELLGKSGRAMIEAMLAGEEDPQVLADLARRRLRVKIPQLRDALAGRPLADHQKLLVRQLLAQIDLCASAVTELDREIEVMLAPFGAGGAGDDDPRGGPADGGVPDRRGGDGHEPVPDRGAPGVLGGDLPE